MGQPQWLNNTLRLAKAQFADMERKLGECQQETGGLKARLEMEQREHQRTKEELEQLKREHEEEIQIYDGVEFRRGKRTNGNWMPFCPAPGRFPSFANGVQAKRDCL